MAPSAEVHEDASGGPFEGPEKLLELWFQPSAEHVAEMRLPIKGGRRGNPAWTGLRQVDRSVWDGMLSEVECKVLSVIEGEEVDAYLLSESSMFVWPHKLILKTCGTTTLLLGLPTLLRIASEICSLRGVWRCFYSRKAFMFPDRQRGPHKDWTHEMKFLDKLFENSSAYTVGRMNGDHWLLYLTPPQSDVLQPHVLASSSAMPPALPTTPLAELSESLSFNLAQHSTPLPSPPLPTKRFYQPDQTLEILMTRLDSSVCKSFYHPAGSGPGEYTSTYDESSSSDAHALGAELSQTLGLSALLPDATIDSFLFSPCGYSSNAVQGDRYATIHVTPEDAYSYASFETNVSFGTTGRGPKKLADLVNRVLDIFRPASMSITLFVSDDEDEALTEPDSAKQRAKNREADDAFNQLLNPHVLAQYERLDKIVYSFEGYRLLYCVFSLREAS